MSVLVTIYERPKTAIEVYGEVRQFISSRLTQLQKSILGVENGIDNLKMRQLTGRVVMGLVGVSILVLAVTTLNIYVGLAAIALFAIGSYCQYRQEQNYAEQIKQKLDILSKEKRNCTELELLDAATADETRYGIYILSYSGHDLNERARSFYQAVENYYSLEKTV